MTARTEPQEGGVCGAGHGRVVPEDQVPSFILEATMTLSSKWIWRVSAFAQVSELVRFQ